MNSFYIALQSVTVGRKTRKKAESPRKLTLFPPWATATLEPSMTMRLKETSGIEEAIGLDNEDDSEAKGIGRGTEDDVQGPIVFCGRSDRNKRWVSRF